MTTGESIIVEARDGRKGPSQRVLKVSGTLSYPHAEVRFLELVRVETAKAVILDLSGVTTCDSRGVGSLVQINEAFKRENRRLALAAITERTRVPLRYAQVLPYFTIFATVDEAEDTFG